MKSSHKNITQSRKISYYDGFSDVRNTKRVKQEGDDALGNLGRIYGWECKREGSAWYASPVYGYIKKNVGRKYDKIKSELYKRYTGEFERYTLDRMLDRFISDKKYHFMDSFYIDDKGVLRLHKADNKKYRRETFNKIHVINNNHYYKHEDIWYEVKVAVATKGVYWESSFYREGDWMHFLRYNINRTGVYGSYGTYSYNKVIVAKRQLNKREIKKLCLQQLKSKI